MIRNILSRRPDAMSIIKGSADYSEVIGVVKFYQTRKGVIVAAEVNNLPYLPGKCEHFVFGLHIHEGRNCRGNKGDVFAGSMMHYNPNQCPHPRHAGDLAPLLGNKGYALSIFLTNRFYVEEIIGRTVIIHGSPDDFKTQPSGNSGEKIACGIIE